MTIKTCKLCPNFKTCNQWSSDGWDRMEDWVCTHSGNDKIIARSVEWHEESKIDIPSWCPFKQEEIKKVKLQLMLEQILDTGVQDIGDFGDGGSMSVL